MIRLAIISDDKAYRYFLSREWDATLPKIGFIMLNPATADNTTDDATMRRVISFAKSWGYGGVLVGNLYAYRTKKPADLRTVEDPEGPENQKYVKQIIGLCDKIVYAWGNHGKEPDWLRVMVSDPYCIVRTKRGNPGHPLRLRGNLNTSRYRSVG
jgi:hypothetical protein